MISRYGMMVVTTLPHMKHQEHGFCTRLNLAMTAVIILFAITVMDWLLRVGRFRISKTCGGI
eukprot:scaffold18237_cov90-Attheya_sp.AAC.2